MTDKGDSGALQVEKAVYGGDGLARRSAGEIVFVPFALPGEVVEHTGASRGLEQIRVLRASPDRVAPRCAHFGTCGGCQYQMAAYPAQLAMKQAILQETLERAGLNDLPVARVWASPEAWGYRNRIRLRVRAAEAGLQLGYNVRGSEEFLPIRMCPIAAPVLWACAEALLQAAAAGRDARAWLGAAAEVELFCDAEGSKVQVHLLCAGAVPAGKGSWDRFAGEVRQATGKDLALAASRFHPASGRPGELLASTGADGLAYRVGEHTFWLKRGSFFQVNRFLVPAMVRVVEGERHGQLAWDLYAGAGLFSRALAQHYAQVTAVEASPVALDELRRGLRAKADLVIGETVLAFLRRAQVQRERPDVVVLDPPRAGAGEEACGLLLRLAPAEIVYVSCDPTTLARDAAVLVGGGYRVSERHMFDLFPQTYHLETVMVFVREGMQT